jgi:hypothetical protein
MAGVHGAEAPKMPLSAESAGSESLKKLFANIRGQSDFRLQTRRRRRTIMELMKVNVECYAGRKADERPVRFGLEGRQYFVETVLDQWYDPENIFYKVRADDGNLYILRQQTSTPDGAWDLVSFRQTGQER